MVKWIGLVLMTPKSLNFTIPFISDPKKVIGGGWGGGGNSVRT